MYLTIKLLHISFAAISISGFILRAALKLRASPTLEQPLMKWGPHLIDSLLLASAAYLAVNSQQYPLTQSWLTAKVIALLLYIGCGLVVLRFAQNNRQRYLAIGLALICFCYIVSTALTRNPWPWP